MAMSFICSFVRLQMHLEPNKIAAKKRFKYLLKTERAKDYSIALKSQYSKKIFSRQEVEQFLKLEGFSLLQNQLTTWAMKLFKEIEKQIYTEKQVIALIGRLSVDEEVESQFRNIFQYFSPVNGKITAKQLRRGLQKLGENVKEREADRILLEMDLNGLGYIQFEDFLEAMMA